MTPVPAGSSHYAEYGAIAVLALLTIVLVFTMMTLVRVITRVFSRIPVTAAKETTYECGEQPVGSAWFRFNNRFYLIAILFLVFDVEVALMMPVLARYTTALGAGQGAPVLLHIAIFAGTLLLGLVYASARGDLSWNRTIRVDQGADRD